MFVSDPAQTPAVILPGVLGCSKVVGCWLCLGPVVLVLGSQYSGLEAWEKDPPGEVRSGLAGGAQCAEGIESYLGEEVWRS